MMMLTVEPGAAPAEPKEALMRPEVAPVQPGAAPAEYDTAFVGPKSSSKRQLHTLQQPPLTNGVCSI